MIIGKNGGWGWEGREVPRRERKAGGLGPSVAGDTKVALALGQENDFVKAIFLAQKK